MKYLFYSFLIVCLSSCGVKYQSIPYFTNLANEPVLQDSLNNYKPYIIQKNDAFTLEVSSLNTMASAVFNTGATAGASAATPASGTALSSYQVDSEGNLRIPLAGSVKVEGLTLLQARIKIEESLKTYLKEPIANLNMVNFKISVLGDVLKPGAYRVENERINVLEALSLAGDLNITAMRENVLLVRDKEGKKEYIRLNLQDKQLFHSPYYQLRNGDMLYIQPGEAKYASIDSRYRNTTLLMSIISVSVLIYTQIVR